MGAGDWAHQPGVRARRGGQGKDPHEADHAKAATTSPGERPRKTPALVAPRPRAAGPRDDEKLWFCLLGHAVRGALSWRPRQAVPRHARDAQPPRPRRVAPTRSRRWPSAPLAFRRGPSAAWRDGPTVRVAWCVWPSQSGTASQGFIFPDSYGFGAFECRRPVL